MEFIRSIYITMILTCLFNRKWTVFPNTALSVTDIGLYCSYQYGNDKEETAHNPLTQKHAKVRWVRALVFVFFTHLKNTNFRELGKGKTSFPPPFIVRKLHSGNSRGWRELGQHPSLHTWMCRSKKKTHPWQRSVVLLPDFKSLLPNGGVPPGATETSSDWGGTIQRLRILFLSFVFILNKNFYTPLRLTANGEWCQWEPWVKS